MNSNAKNMSKFLTLFVVYLPILSIYKSPVPKLDLGSFLLLINIGLVFVAYKRNSTRWMKKISSLWVVYVWYVLMITFTSIMVCDAYTSRLGYILRTIKYIVFVIFTLAIARNGLFDCNYAHNILIFSSIVSTLYIMLQFVVYRMCRIGLPGYIPSLIFRDAYSDTLKHAATTVMYRPTSFFYEPAHYAEYVLLALVYCLFYNRKRGKYISSIIITIGIFISTSGQGIVFALFLWGIWAVEKMRKVSNEQRCCLIASLCGMCLMIWYLIFSTRGKQVLARIFDNQYGGNAIEARAKGYIMLKEMHGLQWLFGNGYGNVTEGIFFSSWAFDIWCLGVVGTVMVFGIYIYLYHYTNVKILVVLNALMSVFSTVCMGYYFVYYMSFILSDKKVSNGGVRKESFNNYRFNLS